jgi:hypothetical protein
MFKYKLLFLGAVLLLFVGGGYALLPTLPSVSAAPVKGVEPTLVQVPTDVPESDSAAGDTVVAQAPANEQDVFQEITDLKEKFDAYAMQPGWVLMKYDQNDILPTTGPRPLPSKHQREAWRHFNDNRLIFEEVEYATAPELGRVKLGYFVKGETVSLWNEGIRQQQQPYTPSYDLSLVSSVKSLRDSKATFELNSHDESDATSADRAVKVIELKVKYSEQDLKWLNVKFEKPVWGTYEVFFFDPKTGMLLRYEFNYVLDDMSLIPGAVSDNFQIVPNSIPPADVIKTLGG